MTLHLLRPFTQWYDGGTPIKTIEAAEAYVGTIYGAGWDRFYTWSSRWPRRVEELKGGSVYFVQKRRTLFHMPFVEVEESGGGCAICMRPVLIRCEQWSVGMVRGWRYLKAADAPPDIPMPVEGDDELPPELAQELKEMGL